MRQPTASRSSWASSRCACLLGVCCILLHILLGIQLPCVQHFVAFRGEANMRFGTPRAAQAVLHTAAVPPPLQGMHQGLHCLLCMAQRRCRNLLLQACCLILCCPIVNLLQLDGINLFAILSIISIFYCLPCALVIEGAGGGEARHDGGGAGPVVAQSGPVLHDRSGLVTVGSVCSAGRLIRTSCRLLLIAANPAGPMPTFAASAPLQASGAA